MQHLNWVRGRGRGEEPDGKLLILPPLPPLPFQMRCMADGEWLNDEAINLYMALLQVRGKGGSGEGGRRSTCTWPHCKCGGGVT